MRRAGLVALLLVTAACGSAVQAGTAEPLSSSAADGPSSGAASSTSSVSPSATVDLAGVDPCTVLASAELAQLGYFPPGLPPKQTGVSKVACTFRDMTGTFGGGLFLDSGQGVEQYSVASNGKVVTPLQIAGYMAYSVQDQLIGGCTVGVGLAASQTLAATRNGSQSQPVGPQCDKAVALATAAVNAITSK